MYIYSADWLSVRYCDVHACYYIFMYTQSHHEHNDMCVRCVQCSGIYTQSVGMMESGFATINILSGVEPKDVSYFIHFQ